jgi:hypothetical protein
MLNIQGIGGQYRGLFLSVDVMLENPLDYGIDPSMMVFDVNISARNDNTDVFSWNDFTFYVLDKHNRLYIAQSIPKSFLSASPVKDTGEPSNALRGLVQLRLRPVFLYHDLRVAFFYHPSNRIKIITLTH